MEKSGSGVELLNPAQIFEAQCAIGMFKNMYRQTLIAPLAQARRLTDFSVAMAMQKLPLELQQQSCKYVGYVFDFDSPEGLKQFLDTYRVNKQGWDDLEEGFFKPVEYFSRSKGRLSYPIFTIVNPLLSSTNFPGFWHSYNLEGLGNEFNRYLHRITKFGRVFLVITPDMVNRAPGTLWQKLPESYNQALAQPAQLELKRPIAEYLLSRGFIPESGLAGQCESTGDIITPQIPLLDAEIQSALSKLGPNSLVP